MATWKRPSIPPREGLAKADARSDRDNDEGTVAIAVDGNTAAVVQIDDIDFSAKNNAVTTLAQTLPMPSSRVAPVRSMPTPMPSMISRSRSRRTSNWGGRVHRCRRQHPRHLPAQPGRARGERRRRRGQRRQRGPPPGRSACRAAKPTYLSSDEIPADDIEKEGLKLEITKAEGKPEQARDKIVTGRLNAWKGGRASRAGSSRRQDRREGQLGRRKHCALRPGCDRIMTE